MTLNKAVCRLQAVSQPQVVSNPQAVSQPQAANQPQVVILLKKRWFFWEIYRISSKYYSERLFPR